MKVLLTGAAGRLGLITWRALLDAGHEVRATDCRYQPELPGPLELADLTDAMAAYKLLRGCDAVAHLGNIPGMVKGMMPQQIYRNNVTMNFALFQAAADLGLHRIVFASTIQVISGTRGHDDLEAPSQLPYLPLDGDVPALPGNAYGLSKHASEQMLQFFHRINGTGSHTVIRFPFLVNPAILDRRLLRGKRPRWRPGKVDEVLSLLHFHDAAELIRLALEQGLPGYHQYFPSADAMPPGWTPAEAIEAFFPGVPVRKPVEQLTSLVDIAAIRDALGWEPTHSAALLRQLSEAAQA